VRGVMTAEEISALNLSAVELCVLSACETNVGLRRGGQGIASLQAALHAAGVRTAITSLWKVQDEATRELMTELYRRLWVLKEPKAKALWNAKKKLREQLDADGKPRRSGLRHRTAGAAEKSDRAKPEWWRFELPFVDSCAFMRS
jgi:CHAT domain-containing protein